MPSTVAEILAAAQQRLISNTALGYNAEQIMIRDEETFVDSNHDLYFQITPGTLREPHGDSGVDLTEIVIRISVFAKDNKDDRTTRAERATRASDVLDSIEAAFVSSWLNGTLDCEPLRLVAASTLTGAPVPASDGWVRGFREFIGSYETGRPQPQTNQSGSGADRGAPQ